MQKVIITGHSRGLGRALAEHYLAAGAAVLGLPRSLWLKAPGGLQQQAVDLADADALSALFSDGLFARFCRDADEVVLINNAAVVEPNALLGQQQSGEIVRAVALNVTAPLLLSNHLAAVAAGRLKIVHIGSGAGRKAYPGWSVYGATKAALDRHAACAAAEGVCALSVAPGVVDTEMQRSIRETDAADFPLQAQFARLHDTRALTSASQAAKDVAALIAAADGGHVWADVRD